MALPPPPFQSGPAWDKNGTLNPTWARWFTLVTADSISTNTTTDVVPTLTGTYDGTDRNNYTNTGLFSAGFKATDRVSTAIGVLSPRSSVRDFGVKLAGRLPPSVGDYLLSLLMFRNRQSISQPFIFCTQSTFPSAGSLTDPTIIYVKDYAHFILYTGGTFSFMGDQSGCVSLWENDPGTGYHLCDGSTVNRLNADGTVTSVTLKDLTTAPNLAAFLQAGGANSGPTAAVAPGISGDTAGTSVTITGTTASGTASISAVSGNTNNDSGPPQTVQAGAGASVPAEPHTHGFTVSPTDSGHTHNAGTLAGSSHTHAVGTLVVDSTGEPRKLVRRPYYRQ